MPETASTWIKELRDRTHKLTSTVAAVDLRVQSLDARVEQLGKEVRRMATADEIAKGVADEIRRRDVDHREKIDGSMKRLVWAFGLVLTVLQIASIIAVKGLS